jgi:hypothetical protein
VTLNQGVEGSSPSAAHHVYRLEQMAGSAFIGCAGNSRRQAQSRYWTSALSQLIASKAAPVADRDR